MHPIEWQSIYEKKIHSFYIYLVKIVQTMTGYTITMEKKLFDTTLHYMEEVQSDRGGNMFNVITNHNKSM